MSHIQTEKHAIQVDAWISQIPPGLTSDRIVFLFADAIWAVQKRAVTTLSEVTLTAVFDRVIHQSQKEFPLLSGMKYESRGISMDGILSQMNRYPPDEIIKALRFFLVELLTILDNLTAGILTKPLYKALSGITGERRGPQLDAVSQISSYRRVGRDREDV